MTLKGVWQTLDAGTRLSWQTACQIGAQKVALSPESRIALEGEEILEELLAGFG
jgi:hypothetical protein